MKIFLEQNFCKTILKNEPTWINEESLLGMENLPGYVNGKILTHPVRSFYSTDRRKEGWTGPASSGMSLSRLRPFSRTPARRVPRWIFIACCASPGFQDMFGCLAYRPSVIHWRRIRPSRPTSRSIQARRSTPLTPYMSRRSTKREQ